MPIEVRISGSEAYDGGYGIEEGVAFAKQLEGHVDLIHVSAGNHEVDEVFTVTHPDMFHGDGCNVRFAAEIKKNVRTPVATVGAIGEPEMMEDIITSGKADVVELARSLIADPDLPNKIRSGKESDITCCMRCLSCFTGQIKYGVKYCAVNPESGREAETLFTAPVAKVKKKVLIAGGGIGGMQAALTCADYGHDVVLFEKSGELGGAIRCERNVPFKKKLDMYLETQIRRLVRSGIDIRLNTDLTPAVADILEPDVIIAAMGAVPVKPGINGINGSNVLEAESIYITPEKAGRRVVIIGAGLVGLELAVYLSMLGREATVVEMAGGNQRRREHPARSGTSGRAEKARHRGLPEHAGKGNHRRRAAVSVGIGRALFPGRYGYLRRGAEASARGSAGTQLLCAGILYAWRLCYTGQYHSRHRGGL